MKISYSDDVKRGPGNGILACNEANFPQGEYSMALRRASDQGYLVPGPNGALWVGEIRFLPVDTQNMPDGSLTVLLGPDVVNALDPLEQYLVTLNPGEGNIVNGRLQVQSVTYSRDRTLKNTGMNDQEPTPATTAMVQPTVESMPEPAPTDDTATGAEQTPLTLNAEAGTSSPVGKGRRTSPVLLVALVAALLAGALATWKFFDGKAQEEKSALAPQNSSPAPSPPSVPSTSLPATQKTAEEQVRAFFSGPDITATAALKLAALLPKGTPAEQDAVYRLYYFANANDAPGAFMPYAKCLDPAEAQWGSIDKDAAAAYAAYAKAAASDAKVAKAALEAQTRLRSWLESEAASGNAKAKAWLQELP